jgi:hypothetical protein
MTQALYAHMNNKTIKKKKTARPDWRNGCRQPGHLTHPALIQTPNGLVSMDEEY